MNARQRKKEPFQQQLLRRDKYMRAQWKERKKTPYTRMLLYC